MQDSDGEENFGGFYYQDLQQTKFWVKENNFYYKLETAMVLTKEQETISKIQKIFHITIL